MASHVSKEFEDRLGRIARRHKAGGGFEAAGALGRLDHAKPPVHRRLAFPLQASLFLLLGFFLFKAALMMQAGADGYALRLTHLRMDGGIDAAVAVLMEPDVISRNLSGLLAQVLR
ncbi:hypothetical protein [Thioclava sp. GXIMD4216]|uniref:hypothetical protein n=1 Tax=unclassified Thioclava TaxID=2621713 RepID=UPI0030CDD37F